MGKGFFPPLSITPVEGKRPRLSVEKRSPAKSQDRSHGRGGWMIDARPAWPSPRISRLSNAHLGFKFDSV